MVAHPSAEWCTAHGGAQAPHIRGRCQFRSKPDLVLLAMKAKARREVRELSDGDLGTYIERMRRLILMAEPDKPEWMVDQDCACLEAAEAEGRWRREAEGKGGPRVHGGGWRERAERVKARAGLLDYVIRELPMFPKGADWWACCPFHQEDSPSFVVHADRGTFRCFGCGVGGDVFDWFLMRHGMTFSEALRHLDPGEPAQEPAAAMRRLVELD